MRKFKIPVIAPTTYKGIRFPDNLILEIEDIIQGKECTFSAFVVEATKVAIENIRIEEQKKKK